MYREMIAKFAPGQVIQHRGRDYRGVIVDVDPVFYGDGDIAAQAVGENEPLDRPWYHVLVNGHEYVTYVSEASIEADDTGRPVIHPSLTLFFAGFEGNHYVPRRRAN